MALLSEFRESLLAFLDGLFLSLHSGGGLLGALKPDAASYGGEVAAHIMQHPDGAVAAHKQVFSACVKFHVVY